MQLSCQRHLDFFGMSWSGYISDYVEYNPIGKQGYLYLKSTSIGFVECDDDYYDEPLVQNNPAPFAPLPPAQPPNNPPQQG